MKIPGNTTLFLDRDGVINRRLEKRYVKKWEEFEFMAGVLEAIPILNQHFNRTLVVTNQRGIGLDLMSIEELESIHQKMITVLEANGGQIDKIYYCSKLYDETPNCRKPEPHMALQAKVDFPEIDFNHAVMVGDQPSDIMFGNKLNMKTVWIPNNQEIKWDEKNFSPDFTFRSLIEFANFINNNE